MKRLKYIQKIEKAAQHDHLDIKLSNINKNVIFTLVFNIFREKKDELPQMQVGFIDMICLPLYKVLSDTFPWILPLYTGTMDNRQRWQDLAEKVEMGLTWIDHDTIDKPIEEFTGT